MTESPFSLPGAARVRYRQTPQGPLYLHVYHPEGHTPDIPRPAIVFFFGGGWSHGTPEQFSPFCECLAARGMVAVSAEYRISSRHDTTPRACVEDGKAAVRYLREHAAEIGIDPARLAAGGGSAGGHVAAATTFLPHLEDGADAIVSCVPDALVLFNPVIDTTESGWDGSKVLGDEREIFSPVHHVVPGAPPTLVMHGDADELVPVENVERFDRLMNQAGNRCELHTYPGQGHGFFNKGRGNGYLEVVCDAMTGFLGSLGWVD